MELKFEIVPQEIDTHLKLQMFVKTTCYQMLIDQKEIVIQFKPVINLLTHNRLFKINFLSVKL